MEIEYCQFLGKVSKNGTITIKPLGRAKNSIDKPTLPGWEKVITEIVIDKNYAKGLDGIEDYSHIIVVYWMDQEKKCHLKHHPPREDLMCHTEVFLPAVVLSAQTRLPCPQWPF